MTKIPAEPQKLLFICSQNKWRSLTAERLFNGHANYEARSAGTEPGARVHVTAGHIGWAEVIFVMEHRHADRIQEKFADALRVCPWWCCAFRTSTRLGTASWWLCCGRNCWSIYRYFRSSPSLSFMLPRLLFLLPLLFVSSFNALAQA